MLRMQVGNDPSTTCANYSRDLACGTKQVWFMAQRPRIQTQVAVAGWQGNSARDATNQLALRAEAISGEFEHSSRGVNTSSRGELSQSRAIDARPAAKID